MIENGRISIENEADIKQDLELLIEPLASFVKFYPEFAEIFKDESVVDNALALV